MKHKVTITLAIDARDYRCVGNARNACLVALAAIKSQADWPRQTVITIKSGKIIRRLTLKP